MMGILSIAFTVGRRDAFTVRHCATSCLSPLLYVEDNGVYAPLTIFIDSMCKLGASKGGFWAIISYSMTPIDQTSVLKV